MARPNRTRFAVLGMLAMGERSGYDLKKDFEHRMSHFWAESVGQIYPSLKRLHSEGLIRARRDPGTGRRRRTLYRLTAKGRRELHDWLREPPEREQVRNEILLKLYFGPELGVEGALAHLARFEAAQRAFLEMLERFEGEIAATAENKEQELFWKITLSSGRHVVRARVAWCEESRQRLIRHQRSGSPGSSATGRRREGG